MRIRFLVLVTLLTIAIPKSTLAQAIPFAGQFQVNNGPTINFTDTSISCTGIAAGDTVALVGYVIASHGFQTTTTPTISRTPTFSRQADANGVFTVDIAGGVKARSIWLLIDETAGSYTVAAPQGSVLRQISDGAVSLAGDTSSSAANVTINRSHTHVLAVLVPVGGPVSDDSRRHVSSDMDSGPPAFSVFDAKDGADTDNDGTIDGVVHLTIPGFYDTSLSASYLFVVDDRTLDFSVLSLVRATNVPRCRPGDC
jgi:hypothetical protein